MKINPIYQTTGPYTSSPTNFTPNAKVAFVALMLLLNNVTLLNENITNTNCLAYPAEGLSSKKYCDPTRNAFPNYLAHMGKPGMILRKNFDQACSYKTFSDVLNDQECLKDLSEIPTPQPDNILLFHSKAEVDYSYAEVGFGIFRDQNPLLQDFKFYKYHYGMNPHRVKGLQNMLNQAQRKILQNDSFFQKSSEEIVDSIVSLHATLCKDLTTQYGEKIPLNTYRKESILIHRTEVRDAQFDRESLFSLCKSKLNFSQKELKALKRAYRKVDEFIDFDEAFQNFSREEIAAFKKHVYIFPDPAKIDRLMQKFAIELKEKFTQMQNRSLDPINFAAWVHMELVKIHPFVEVL